MKKSFSLLLVIVMLLSLCACGGSDSPDKSDSSNYIGTWESETLCLVITKGGVVRWGFSSEGTDISQSTLPINWEIKDEVLVVTTSMMGFDFNAVFELNAAGDILNEIQKTALLPKKMKAILHM